MREENAFTRYNKAMDRKARRARWLDNLKIIGLIVLFGYVVWDAGHIEPRSETAQLLGGSHAQ